MINEILISIILFVAMYVVFCRSNIVSIFMMNVFSMLCMIWYTVMMAPDVAITEAAVGVALSGIIMLLGFKNINTTHIQMNIRMIIGSLPIILLMSVVIYHVGLLSMPLGDSASPMNNDMKEFYFEMTKKIIQIPNVVAAVLTSFRGFDTLLETSVIFISAFGVYEISSGSISANAKTQSSKLK